ncbi:hypothetical protein KKG48_01745 [Patescibacteria group bacterium]|nr:hypothetical protein [Patescibacteria group bacterium]
MARKKLEERNIRKLSKSNSSYYITLPIEGIRDLGWKKSQKLVAEVDSKKKRIIIRDWPARNA